MADIWKWAFVINYKCSDCKVDFRKLEEQIEQLTEWGNAFAPKQKVILNFYVSGNHLAVCAECLISSTTKEIGEQIINNIENELKKIFWSIKPMNVRTSIVKQSN